MHLYLHNIAGKHPDQKTAHTTDDCPVRKLWKAAQREVTVQSTCTHGHTFERPCYTKNGYSRRLLCVRRPIRSDVTPLPTVLVCRNAPKEIATPTLTINQLLFRVFDAIAIDLIDSYALLNPFPEAMARTQWRLKTYRQIVSPALTPDPSDNDWHIFWSQPIKHATWNVWY
ncbi:hypothetical protein BDB00DRAFT_785829 [Zychaea mexicana]|uniref:uncharacterized protein n=1 Tax=Zychaea mexicana TaxID=64656 RepID=UPI0022FE1134|nr:uncharacterized protein BDB00DRAFT_785829 [Zychaea mexicana]KAI9496137.1 hypothetical protein BDB00DRAFT_785829 [Zychaea mexicana]